MSSTRRLKWLKYILAAKIALILFVWGLPYLFAPMSYFQRLGLPAPEDPIFIRFLGAVVVAFGVAYWYAYRDPVHNIAILKAGVVDNGLVTLVIVVFTAFYNLRNVLMWVSGLLTFVFFISFILLMPRTEAG